MPSPIDRPPWIVAIGASGSEGLGDIRELLAALADALAAVIMIVLHRDGIGQPICGKFWLALSRFQSPLPPKASVLILARFISASLRSI
jgi:hypothetical protein